MAVLHAHAVDEVMSIPVIQPADIVSNMRGNQLVNIAHSGESKQVKTTKINGKNQGPISLMKLNQK